MLRYRSKDEPRRSSVGPDRAAAIDLENVPGDEAGFAVVAQKQRGAGNLVRCCAIAALRRFEREKANLLYWQLTCLSFHSPQTWAWIYEKCGYPRTKTGDS
jgi:hypothetical protein